MSRPRIGSLCTGYGGLDMAVQQVLGGSLAWVSDPDPGAARILAHHYPDVPNLGDLTAVDWETVEPVDIVCGGYPCQPFSLAGLRKGTADARHLWPHIARALRVLRPKLAIFENVANHLRIGFDQVLRDLAALGFDAEWCVVRAEEVGAPHRRERLFVVAWPADTKGAGRPWPGLRGRAAQCGAVAAHADYLGGDGRPARTGQAGREVPAGHAPTDAGGLGRGPGECDIQPGQPDTEGRTLADASGERRGEGRPEPAGLEGGSGAAVRSDVTPADAESGQGRVRYGDRAVAADAPCGSDTDGPVGDPAVQLLAELGPGRGTDAGTPATGTDGPARGAGVLAWGQYEPAIRRWERTLGRPAPAATNDHGRLSPAFVEWMMGLPPGHVTAVPGLTRTAQLKALGNGVVPQQAAAALRLLLTRAGFGEAVAA